MSEKEPLPKKVTDEMIDILNKIKSGEYKHYQGHWHCGSAHCFFGWKHYSDAYNAVVQTFGPEEADQSFGYTEHESSEQLDSDLHFRPFREDKAEEIWHELFKRYLILYWPESTYGPSDEWDAEDYVRFRWGLSQHESYYLSDAARTLDELFIAVGLLADGKRYYEIGEINAAVKRYKANRKVEERMKKKGDTENGTH